ncbi:hypothetical protein PR202_gb07742 [Eleusine coracana subsp. coracana]|uniref:Histidine kinase/HSP90-like ATPase domain-containing protein n=1 Tax=Eleusine coracana subsp. coracana TaxID=191504 RepID=A0AAV5EC56_ELECO|nr:hypothetical protein PR202_gb07742 [Eleusine coracana subsp. coracana]
MPAAMAGASSGSGGGGGRALDCRSFWKAGAYEAPAAPTREYHGSIRLLELCSWPGIPRPAPLLMVLFLVADALETGDFDRARVHPKFLHTNATSHKWAFGVACRHAQQQAEQRARAGLPSFVLAACSMGLTHGPLCSSAHVAPTPSWQRPSNCIGTAIAELLDNAVDEICNGATYIKVDKSTNLKDNSPMLVFQDDGGGMDPEGIRRCMSLGFSTKKSKTTIGQSGAGMRGLSAAAGAAPSLGAAARAGLHGVAWALRRGWGCTASA